MSAITSVGFGQLDKAPLLTQASVKTASYTATANQVVPVDTTTGPVTITLPNAPAGGTMMAVKHIIQGSTNTVTVACGGADVLNKTGGSVTMTLTLLGQGVLLEYNTGIWVNLADDLPLTQLDLRYTTPTALSTAIAPLAPLASPALTGNPTAPTQAASDNSTRLATTAFVTTAAAGAGTLGTATFSTSTVNVNVATASTYAVSLTGTPAGGTASFAITGTAGSGAQTLTLFITQGGAGGFTVHWPTSVTWITGTAPVLAATAGALSIVSLETVNGGTTWYGTQVTGAPSLPLSVANGGTGQGLYSPIDNIWRASDMGYITQSFDVVPVATVGRAVTSGVLSLTGLPVRTAATVTGVRVIVQNGAGITLTASQSFLGLYGSAAGAGGAGTLLGSASSNSSAVALSTAWAVASSTFLSVATLTAAGTGTLNLTPGMYWVAILSVGTTPPSFGGGGTNVTGQVANGTLPVSNARSATQGSALTALPTSFTPSTNVAAQTSIWAALY